MKRTLAVALLFLSIPLLAKGPASDPRLQAVNTIFVEGNNQAAEQARNELREGKTCFVLADTPESADAVLALDTDTNSQGQDAMSFGSFGGRNWIVSGTLKLRDSGALIWSKSERFADAPFKSGGKTAGKLLLSRLSRDAACKNRENR